MRAIPSPTETTVPISLTSLLPSKPSIFCRSTLLNSSRLIAIPHSSLLDALQARHSSGAVRRNLHRHLVPFTVQRWCRGSRPLGSRSPADQPLAQRGHLASQAAVVNDRADARDRAADDPRVHLFLQPHLQAGYGTENPLPFQRQGIFERDSRRQLRLDHPPPLVTDPCEGLGHLGKEAEPAVGFEKPQQPCGLGRQPRALAELVQEGDTASPRDQRVL